MTTNKHLKTFNYILTLHKEVVAVKVLAKRLERASHEYAHPIKKKLLAAAFTAALLMEGFFSAKPAIALAKDVQLPAPQQQTSASCNSLERRLGSLDSNDEELMPLIKLVIKGAVDKKDTICLMQIASNGKFPENIQLIAGTEAVELYRKTDDTNALEVIARNQNMLLKVRVAAGIAAIKVHKKGMDASDPACKLLIKKICKDPTMPPAVQIYAEYILLPPKKPKPTPQATGVTGR